MNVSRALNKKSARARVIVQPRGAHYCFPRKNKYTEFVRQEPPRDNDDNDDECVCEHGDVRRWMKRRNFVKIHVRASEQLGPSLALDLVLSSRV